MAGTQLRSSDYKGALATWTEVRDLAEANHQDLSRARAWNGLAQTYADLGTAPQAHDAARVASAIVKPMVGFVPDQIRANIHSSEGYALWTEGKREAALVEMLAAYHGQQDLYRDNPFRVAGTETDLGGLLGEMGRYDESLHYLELARAHFLSVEGSSHPALASVTANEGNVLYREGDYAGAAARYREATAIRDRAAIPADNLGRGLDALNLGEALVHLGQADEAAASLARARAIVSAQISEDGLEFAEALTWSGNAELARGRPADAVPYLERAIAIYGKHAETVPTDRAVADLGLARAVWDARPAERARARDLATQAADAFATAKDPRADDARTWLSAHPGP